MFDTPIALFIALGLVGRPAVPLPDGAAPAAEALRTLLATPVFDGGRLDLGVAVRCTTDDRSWAESSADTLLNPASGTKLLTTAAALTRLAPTIRWATVLHGNRVGDVVEGDLVLVAEGDPWLQVADLDRLAQALAAGGVREVTGGLVADVSRFEGPDLPPAYDQKKTDAGYRPAVPALGVAFGTAVVNVRPGRRAGDPVRVSTSPSVKSIVVESSATTVAGKASDKLSVEVRGGAEGRTRVIVTGSLGQAAGGQAVKKRVEDPARVAADVLAVMLAKRGVEMRGAVSVTHAAAPRGPELARVESRSLAEIVREINTFSNNYMAETLFVHLGEDASGRAAWSRAARAVTDALTALGVPAAGIRVVNGSGLYDATHVSPRAMGLLLDRMAGEAAFRDSLAVAGETGTLRKRMKRGAGKVRGKTGTLDDATSLSGYVQAKSCPLAFSVIVNGPIGDDVGKVQGAVDRFVMTLVDL